MQFRMALLKTKRKLLTGNGLNWICAKKETVKFTQQDYGKFKKYTSVQLFELFLTNDILELLVEEGR